MCRYLWRIFNALIVMTFYEPYVQLSTPDVFRMGPRVVNHDLPKFNLDCERRATTALVRRSPLVYALSSQSISHCVKPAEANGDMHQYESNLWPKITKKVESTQNVMKVTNYLS